MASLIFSAALIIAVSRFALALHEQAYFLSWGLGKLLSSPLELGVLLDLYSCAFMARVFTIAGRVLLFSQSYIGHEVFFFRFHLLVLRFVLSILLLIIRPNLMRILLG